MSEYIVTGLLILQFIVVMAAIIDGEMHDWNFIDEIKWRRTMRKYDKEWEEKNRA